MIDSRKKLKQAPFRAVNNAGFMVDFITPAADDLQPVEIHKLEWLLLSPKFEAMVIDTSGKPATMVAPDPRAFALHKQWLSAQFDREPEKRARDSMQARAVMELLANRLQHLPLSKAVLQQFPEALANNNGLDWEL